MIGFLAFGSAFFWIIIFFLFAFECLSVFYESGTASTVGLIIIIVILQVSGIPILSYTQHHPIFIVSVLIEYLIVGTLWMFLKWWLFASKVSNQINSYYSEWKGIFINGCRRNNIPVPASEEIFKRFITDCYEYHGMVRKYNLNRDQPLAPSVPENRNRLLFWVWNWPFSAAVTLVNDPLVKIVNGIVNLSGNLLTKISTRALARIDIEK